jgi:hypothetical protein
MDFAYIFSKFCWFYRMTDQQVLGMPLRRFWTMYWQIERIEAEDSIRRVSDLASTNSKEMLKGRLEDLEHQLGTPIDVKRQMRIDERFDTDGAARLKMLGGG